MTPQATEPGRARVRGVCMAAAMLLCGGMVAGLARAGEPAGDAQATGTTSPTSGRVRSNQPAALSGYADASSAEALVEDAPAGSPAPKTAPQEVVSRGLTATVRQADEQTERIRLSKGKSALLTLNRPINRASIAQPEIADVAVLSPTELVVVGKGFGTTQLVLLTADGEQRVFDLLVEVNVALLEELIRATAPSSHVSVRSLLDTIVLMGSVPDAGTAQQVAELAELMNPGKVRNQLSVAGVQQVLIRCTVAEVNRTAMRELNMNWFFGPKISRDFFFANNLNGLTPHVVQNNGLANLLIGQPTYTLLPASNLAPTNTNLTFGFPRADLQFFVQALRTNGLVRVLAEPNLIAISGQKATFLAGGEIPIPIVLQNTFSVEYKKFGIQLDFTPHVVAGQIIRMTVQPEVSDVDPNRQVVIAGFTIPAFTTRRAESTVEVGNGQTFALAGLLNETVRATAQKIPGMGDLPILGTLFSSVAYTRNETELVILVTPELVSPLDPQQVGPVPGQGITTPNDYELFLNQQLEGRPAPAEGQGVPRNELPVNVYPSTGPWASSAMTMALRGPYGMSFDDEEGR